MNDAEATELLRLIKLYVNKYNEDTTEMTLGELIEDLTESTP